MLIPSCHTLGRCLYLPLQQACSLLLEAHSRLCASFVARFAWFSVSRRANAEASRSPFVVCVFLQELESRKMTEEEEMKMLLEISMEMEEEAQRKKAERDKTYKELLRVRVSFVTLCLHTCSAGWLLRVPCHNSHFALALLFTVVKPACPSANRCRGTQGWHSPPPPPHTHTHTHAVTVFEAGAAVCAFRCNKRSMKTRPSLKNWSARKRERKTGSGVAERVR